MWAKENRARYIRGRLRYSSDLTNEEWVRVEPHIPPAKFRRPSAAAQRTVDLREVVNGLNVSPERRLPVAGDPEDLPPRSALCDYFDLWNWDGTLDGERFGRGASAVIVALALRRKLTGLAARAARPRLRSP